MTTRADDENDERALVLRLAKRLAEDIRGQVVDLARSTEQLRKALDEIEQLVASVETGGIEDAGTSD